MLGANVLLFPDTGADFLRSLRFFVLHSTGVQIYQDLDVNRAPEVLAMLDEVEHMRELQGGRRNSAVARSMSRLREYFTFTLQNSRDLLMLQREGLLLTGAKADVSIPEEALEKLPSQIEAIVRDGSERLLADLDKAHHACPPSAFDLKSLRMLSLVREGLKGGWPSTGEDDDISEADFPPALKKSLELGVMFAFWEWDAGEAFSWQHPFVPYVLSSIFAAEAGGLLLSTWLPQLRSALPWIRQYLAQVPVSPQLDSRQRFTQHLEKVVVRKYFAGMDDLPFTEILEIRRKRYAELNALWVTLAEIAAQIDPEEDSDRVNLHVHDLVATKVDPAVEDLRRAVAAARLDALKKLGQSWESLAKATVPATLAFAAGAPLDISAIVGSAGALAGALYEGALERKKLKSASQWSILLELERR